MSSLTRCFSLLWLTQLSLTECKTVASLMRHEQHVLLSADGSLSKADPEPDGISDETVSEPESLASDQVAADDAISADVDSSDTDSVPADPTSVSSTISSVSNIEEPQQNILASSAEVTSSSGTGVTPGVSSDPAEVTSPADLQANLQGVASGASEGGDSDITESDSADVVAKVNSENDSIQLIPQAEELASSEGVNSEGPSSTIGSNADALDQANVNNAVDIAVNAAIQIGNKKKTIKNSKTDKKVTVQIGNKQKTIKKARVEAASNDVDLGVDRELGDGKGTLSDQGKRKLIEKKPACFAGIPGSCDLNFKDIYFVGPANAQATPGSWIIPEDPDMIYTARKKFQTCGEFTVLDEWRCREWDTSKCTSNSFKDEDVRRHKTKDHCEPCKTDDFCLNPNLNATEALVCCPCTTGKEQKAACVQTSFYYALGDVNREEQPENPIPKLYPPRTLPSVNDAVSGSNSVVTSFIETKRFKGKDQSNTIASIKVSGNTKVSTGMQALNDILLSSTNGPIDVMNLAERLDGSIASDKVFLDELMHLDDPGDPERIAQDPDYPQALSDEESVDSLFQNSPHYDSLLGNPPQTAKAVEEQNGLDDTTKTDMYGMMADDYIDLNSTELGNFALLLDSHPKQKKKKRNTGTEMTVADHLKLGFRILDFEVCVDVRSDEGYQDLVGGEVYFCRHVVPATRDENGMVIIQVVKSKKNVESELHRVSEFLKTKRNDIVKLNFRSQIPHTWGQLDKILERVFGKRILGNESGDTTPLTKKCTKDFNVASEEYEEDAMEETATEETEAGLNSFLGVPLKRKPKLIETPDFLCYTNSTDLSLFDMVTSGTRLVVNFEDIHPPERKQGAEALDAFSQKMAEQVAEEHQDTALSDVPVDSHVVLPAEVCPIAPLEVRMPKWHHTVQGHQKRFHGKRVPCPVDHPVCEMDMQPFQESMARSFFEKEKQHGEHAYHQLHKYSLLASKSADDAWNDGKYTRLQEKLGECGNQFLFEDLNHNLPPFQMRERKHALTAEEIFEQKKKAEKTGKKNWKDDLMEKARREDTEDMMNNIKSHIRGMIESKIWDHQSNNPTTTTTTTANVTTTEEDDEIAAQSKLDAAKEKAEERAKNATVISIILLLIVLSAGGFYVVKMKNKEGENRNEEEDDVQSGARSGALGASRQTEIRR